ncbi:hypothetical protein BJ878DRAFT_435879 [Calycina marina]|uniref:Uncharacterized protein n=1 Tax=Calycina marina TaxID=1763456 RepID=A0A9P7Z859_9HELO|nr:hypothetical protein BJ878DRAFT_435879 [Calycina marina]
MPTSDAQRPSLQPRHSASSIHGQTNSPSTSPATHTAKKTKHVVGHGGGRIHSHTRVSSSKGLTKLAKGHAGDASHTELKKGGNSSTNLKKNLSHVSLKRNRSVADVRKKSKGAKGSVKFDIGDTETGEEWEEASSTASPVLSRSASRNASTGHPTSTRSSANVSQSSSRPQSPKASSQTGAPDGPSETFVARSHTDARNPTERLLKRTPSHHTTAMSTTTATPVIHPIPTDDDLSKTHTPDHGLSGSGELISRFVTGSGTPRELFLPRNGSLDGPAEASADAIQRAKSMGNLSRQDEESDSALTPHSRKNSTSHSYNPGQGSRTQQKLWLQRASSNIEPGQLVPASAALNGLGLHGTVYPLANSTVSLSGDKMDPIIKLHLERTGMEYLVVRRHQDPVGKALKRLESLPGMKDFRFPSSGSPWKKAGDGGLSQSLKERRGAKSARSSFDGEDGGRPVGVDEDGARAALRALWEKSFDLSGSAD